MLPEELRKLKDEARDATARGKYRKAAELYGRMAARDKDPQWAHRAGESYLRAGDKPYALARLTQAAAAYANQGLMLKSIAVCTMILEIEPRHVDTQELLATLYARRDSSKPPPGISMPLTHLPPMRSLTPGMRPAMAMPPREVAPAPRVAVPPPPPVLDDPPPVAKRPPAAAPRPFTPARPVAPPPPVALPPPDDDDDAIDDVPLSSVMPEARRSSRYPNSTTIPLDAVPPHVDVADALPRTPLFSSLDAPRLRRLIERVRRVDVPEGAVVIRQGDPAQSLFVIARGKVDVTADVEGSTYLVAQLGEGEFFGELGVMSKSVRMATVTASEPTELIEIERPIIIELFREDPRVRRTLLQFFRERLINRLIATSPLFAPFSGPEARALAEQFELLELEGGATLVTEGEGAPALFVILCGTCDIVQVRNGAEVRIDTSGPGDVCGELSLVTGAPATATVRAKNRVWALAMPQETIIEVVFAHPQVLVQLEEIATSRKHQSSPIRIV